MEAGISKPRDKTGFKLELHPMRRDYLSQNSGIYDEEIIDSKFIKNLLQKKQYLSDKQARILYRRYVNILEEGVRQRYKMGYEKENFPAHQSLPFSIEIIGNDGKGGDIVAFMLGEQVCLVMEYCSKDYEMTIDRLTTMSNPETRLLYPYFFTRMCVESCRHECEDINWITFVSNRYFVLNRPGFKLGAPGITYL